MSSFKTTFHTNCSLPEQPTHVITTPNVRGTLNILWEALSALLLCTWSVQHLNVPAQRVAKSWKQKLARVRVSLFRKLFWMAVTLVAPELLVGAALSERISAHRAENEMKKRSKDEYEWTLTHAFYANMGGFVLDFSTTVMPNQGVPSLGQITHDCCVPSQNSHDVQAVGPSSNSERIPFPAQDGGTMSTGDAPESSFEASPPNDAVIPEVHLRTGVGGNISSNAASPQREDASQINLVELDSAQSQPVVTGNTAIEFDASLPKDTSVDIRASQHNEEQVRSSKDKTPDNNISLVHLEQIDLKYIMKRKHPFNYGGLWIYPKQFSLIWNNSSSNEEENYQESLNGDILGQAIALSAVQHPQSQGCATIQQTRFGADCMKLARLQGSIWAVDTLQLLSILEWGIIEHLPEVGEEELKDQSKGDFLVKGLAMGQSIYLALQLIVRHLRHQPSSQLEIVVVAFAVCSFITFFLFLSKPQDVQTPRVVKAQRYPTAEEMLALARCAPRRMLYSGALESRSYAIENLSFHTDGKKGVNAFVFAGGSIGASIIFGSMHCIAWNFTFPTEVEKLLWRISAIFTIAIPPVFVIFWLTIVWCWGNGAMSGEKGKKIREFGFSSNTPRGVVVTYVLLLFGLVYTLARLYVIVEVFRSLFFLPREAFQTTVWLSSLPVVG